MTLDQFIALSEKQIATILEDSKMILSERQRTGGREFHRFVYTGTQGIHGMRFEQRCWIIEDKAYILTFGCEINQLDRYQSAGEEILNSFELN